MRSLLADRRILVVEDEMLIAALIQDALEEVGCEIVGPVAKLDAAIHLATVAAIDAAILDVTIRGGNAYPVASILLERNIPFVFASGYGDWALPSEFRDRPRLHKPFSMEELVSAVTGALES